MKKYIYYLIIYLLIYTAIKFNFIIPVHISMVIFPIALLKYKNILKDKFLLKYILILLYIILVYFFMISLSEYKDFYFIKYLLSQIIFLVSGVYLVSRMKKKEITNEEILNGIIFAVILEGMICILMKIFPKLFVIFSKIIYTSELSLIIMENSASIRFMGLGSFGFLGGVIAGYGVLISSFLYIKTKKNMYIWKYIFCIISGMLVARTTIVSVILSFLYFIRFFFTIKRNKILINKKLLKIMSFFSLLIIISLYIYNLINQNIKNNYIKWSTEIFTILSEDKPRSLETLLKLIDNIKNVKLEIIFWGNGKWNYAENIIDIQTFNILRTDVGYYRILFYTGILGLILFLIYSLYLYIYMNEIAEDKKLKFFIKILSFYFLILNIKGFINNNTVIYLILGIILLTKKEKKKYGRKT